MPATTGYSFPSLSRPPVPSSAQPEGPGSVGVADSGDAPAGQHVTAPVPPGAGSTPPPAGVQMTNPVPALAVSVPAPRPTAARAPRAGGPARPTGPMSRTRRGLLTGARAAFAERGLRRTTMQHVAAAAGVAKATLYNHFRTKDDVAAALLAYELDRLAALATELPLTVAVPALAEEVGAHPVLRRLAETEPETLARMLTTDADRWADIAVALGTALGLTRVAAEVFGRWLLGLVLQPGNPAERAQQAAQMTRMLQA
ncbi:TetR family transcriptional regulator [Modestobacter sp. URMC 112]